MLPQESEPVSDAEAAALFADLKDSPALVLAVSGGPDSTALMWLAARWRAARKQGPTLIAITVDHGLRKEAKREAAAVARLARKLKIAHRTLRWTGRKPATGLQQAARAARYRLLGEAARKAGATHILTAHTRDDQAETVLIRMSRGSGITGLGAMSRISVIPGRPKGPGPESILRSAGVMDSGLAASRRPGMTMLVRPLLDLSKSRLLATLAAARIPFAEDPSNRDPRFTRARLRGLMPKLAEEGLDAPRLAALARRLKRADAALEAATDQATSALLHLSHRERSAHEVRRVRGYKLESQIPPHPNPLPTGEREPAVPRGEAVAIDAAGFAVLPAEIALRLLGRAIAAVGDEGPVELGKLEALKEALDTARAAGARFRRTLAGAIVTLAGDSLVVERAPPRSGKREMSRSGKREMPRRGKKPVPKRQRPLTKHRPKRARPAKSR